MKWAIWGAIVEYAAIHYLQSQIQWGLWQEL